MLSLDLSFICFRESDNKCIWKQVVVPIQIVTLPDFKLVVFPICEVFRFRVDLNAILRDNSLDPFYQRTQIYVHM